MARLQLEVTGAGARAVGFFPRDRADEAVAELEDLLRTLSPDGRPVLYTWEADGPTRRLVERVAEERSTWSWDVDRAELVGEIDGLPLSARVAAGAWTLLLDGEPLSGRPLTDRTARTLGSRRHPAVEAAPVARYRGDLRLTLAFSDGVPLPPDAIVEGTWGAVRLGRGTPDGIAWVWPLPAERPENEPLRVDTDLVVAGKPVTAQARVVAATDWRGVQAIVGGRALAQLPAGAVIEGFRFPGDGPPSVPLLLRGEGFQIATVGRRWGGDPASYAVDPFALPGMRLPAPIIVRPEGQDHDAGAIVVGPAQFHGVWTLAKDARGDARLPRLTPDFVRLQEPVRWSGTPEGRVRVAYGEVAVEAPLADHGFTPIYLEDLGVPLDKGRLGRAPDGPMVAWAPGYPVLTLEIEADRRIRAKGSALRELAIESARRGVPLRLETPRGRGVVYPADRAAPGPEVNARDGVFALSAGLWTVWFRGLWLDAKASPTEGALVLERPLPIDGRLGLDVGPFLPLRAADVVRGEIPDRGVWNGLMWGRDPAKRDGVVFFGWSLDPAFAAPATGPFPAYGFRAGPPVENTRFEAAEPAVRLFRR